MVTSSHRESALRRPRMLSMNSARANWHSSKVRYACLRVVTNERSVIGTPSGGVQKTSRTQNVIMMIFPCRPDPASPSRLTQAAAKPRDWAAPPPWRYARQVPQPARHHRLIAAGGMGSASFLRSRRRLSRASASPSTAARMATRRYRRDRPKAGFGVLLKAKVG